MNSLGGLSSIEEPAEGLIESGELKSQLDSIKDWLRDLKVHQIKSIESSDIDRTTFDELNRTVKDDLSKIEQDLQNAELLADECEDDLSRDIALRRVEELQKEINQLRSTFRSVCLDAKRRLDSVKSASSRAELLRSATTARSTSQNRSSNPVEALMSASSDVAQSLQNTLEVMKQELDRSVLSTQMLEQQTATLKLASDQYTSFGDFMKTSKLLINSLKRADLIDRVLFSLAFGLFILVCAYILKKRIFDRGISFLSTILRPIYRATRSSSASTSKTSLQTANEDSNIAIAATTAVTNLVAPLSVANRLSQPQPRVGKQKKSRPEKDMSVNTEALGTIQTSSPITTPPPADPDENKLASAGESRQAISSSVIQGELVRNHKQIKPERDAMKETDSSEKMKPPSPGQEVSSPSSSIGPTHEDL